ncbi:MAG: anti-sigma factor domain-containing protein [Chloroflexota bacterium]
MSRRYDPPLSPHDEHMEELAAAYALDAVDSGDREQFLDHLSGCSQCAALVRDYHALTLAFPLSVDEMDGSPGLRDRVFAAIEADTRAQPRIFQPSAPQSIDARRGSKSPLWGLAVAALLVVTLGMGYWNVRLQSELRQVQQTAALEQDFVAALAAGAQRHSLSGTAEAPRAHGAVVPDPAGGQPFLLVGDLPDLPGDRSYQAWVVGASGPVDAGVLPAGARGHLSRLNRAPRPGDTVALTVEPAGGVSAPTGQIVLAGVI